jgi:hypothetical protein
MATMVFKGCHKKKSLKTIVCHLDDRRNVSSTEPDLRNKVENQNKSYCQPDEIYTAVEMTDYFIFPYLVIFQGGAGVFIFRERPGVMPLT